MTMAFPHLLRLSLAGILALPALLLLVGVAPFVILLSIPSLAILVRRKRSFLPSFSFPPQQQRTSTGNNNDNQHSNDDDDNHHHPLLQHAVITGGSSGIGLSIALELAKRKCRHITLVARKEGQLADAKRLVETAAATAATAPASSSVSSSKTTSSVHVVSVDVTDYTALEKAVTTLCVNNSQLPVPGPPTLLFNCAGYSTPLAFEDLTPSNFRSQVDVNYLGSVHVVKAFLPHMTQNGIGGNIILTSSMSGQTGTYGYSGYSPTKFALRGFAECLSMELAAKKKNEGSGSNSIGNVNISLAYPPDTKTPGYEIEMQSKPEACRLISESGGLWDAEVVGKKMVNEAMSPNPSFDIYFGIDGWMLATLTSGMNPVTSLVDAIYQVALMGLLRFVSLFYLMDFGRITQRCHDTEKTRAGSEDSSKED